MKTGIHRIGVAVVAALALAGGARAGVETTETWSVTGVAGWTNESAGALLSNPGGYLDVRFNAQAIPALVEDRAWVEVPAGVVLTNLQFQFLATNLYPSALRVVLRASTNGHTWQLNLAPPQVGPWQAYRVPVAFGPGWFMGPDNSAEAFAVDQRLFDRVAVYLRRHGAPEEQHYGIDAFTLQGYALSPLDRDADGMPNDWEDQYALDPDDPLDAGDDTDGDGMSNYGEYRAGTDPRDVESVFRVQIARGEEPPGTPVEGVVLSWNSISNRTYAVWRALELRTNGFDQVDAGVAATPPVNTYVAPVETNTGAAYYRIDVEAP